MGKREAPQSGTSRPSRQAASSGQNRNYAGQNQKTAKKKKKNKMPGWQKAIIIVLVVLIVLVILFLVAAWLINSKLNKINRIEENEVEAEEVFEVDTEEPDTITDEEIFADTESEEDVLEQEAVINILVIGRDSRAASSDRGNSDTMIIVSLNRNTEQISMVSLMRDTYVQIPDHKNNKLNAAFAIGGYELLDETISYNYGIDIDYNVGVSFEGFVDVIDELGGIDIELNSAEANYLELMHDGGYTDQSGYYAGVNHLTGKSALGYARTRYVGTGEEKDDFGRTYRQRVVMTTVYKEIMTHPLNEIWTILDSIMDCIETDMTNAEMVSLGTEFYNMGIDSLQSYRLPNELEYSDQIINGMDVLAIDFDKAHQHLEEWLYSDTPTADNSVDTAN